MVDSFNPISIIQFSFNFSNFWIPCHYECNESIYSLSSAMDFDICKISFIFISFISSLHYLTDLKSEFLSIFQHSSSVIEIILKKFMNYTFICYLEISQISLQSYLMPYSFFGGFEASTISENYEIHLYFDIIAHKECELLVLF